MNKKDVITKEDLEKYYSKCRKIKFNDSSFKPKTIKEILIKLNLKRNEKSDTLYIKNKFHCSSNRHRSINDLIILCKYYLPNITVKEILNTIQENLNIEIEENNIYEKKINFSYCSVIKKHNFRLSSTHWNNKIDDIDLYSNGFKNCKLFIRDII